jgi:tetratricopeptide (TPR) repeat protein
VSIHALVSAVSPAENAGSWVTQQLLIGRQHDDGGRIDQAIAAYQSGLEAATAAGVDQTAADLLAELHAKLGDAYMVGRRFSSAAAQYNSALRLMPTLIACWCNLGDAQLQSGSAKDAIAPYLEAIKLNPAHWTARTNLAQTLMATKQYMMAQALLIELAAERPLDGQLRHQLGKTCFELNDMEEALRHFDDALALDPRYADSLYWIGGIWQRLGDIDAARAAYAQAAQIQPPIRREAVKSPADFRLLALFAPFAGNTPIEYLFKDAAYDAETLALFDGSELDTASLGDFQLVLNLISEADQARTVLLPAARLVENSASRSSTTPARSSTPRETPSPNGCREFPAAAFRQSCVLMPAPTFRSRRWRSCCRFHFPCWRGPRGRMVVTISRRSQVSPSSQAFSQVARTATIM